MIYEAAKTAVFWVVAFWLAFSAAQAVILQESYFDCVTSWKTTTCRPQ